MAKSLLNNLVSSYSDDMASGELALMGSILNKIGEFNWKKGKHQIAIDKFYERLIINQI